MFDWIITNLPTLGISVLLMGLVFLAIRHIYKSHKNGGCSGGCSGCPHACEHANAQQVRQR